MVGAGQNPGSIHGCFMGKKMKPSRIIGLILLMAICYSAGRHLATITLGNPSAHPVWDFLFHMLAAVVFIVLAGIAFRDEVATLADPEVD